MILIFGSLADEMIELMCARLKQLHLKYMLIDPAFSPKMPFTWKNTYDGRVNTEIRFENKSLQIDEITGIYVRFVNTKGGAKNFEFTTEEIENMGFECLANISNFLNAFPGTVINKPKFSVSNDSKIYQQLQISSHGFYTPKTLVTNNAIKVKEFYDSLNGKVIFKSISGIRSIVTKLSSDYMTRLELIKECPAQFQELVEGLEIRVHTVGEKVFATAIESDAIDYRYASNNEKSASFYPVDLPEAIHKACIRLTQSLGLTVAGLDLKKTKEGKFYCFEVNPSPAFIVYERITRQPISKEVALMLEGK